ncbi:MAG TPA: choice-of-anchor D domain-containing protein [Myxococcales bacterium]|jgi:hypothetical protein
MHATRISLLAAALAAVLCACPTPPPVENADTGTTPQADTGTTPKGDGGTVLGDGGTLPQGDGGTLPGDGGTQPGDLTLSDWPAYDFGRVAVGASAEHSFTVTNMGASEAIAMTLGALAAPYEIGSGTTCVTSLASGSSCLVVVKFAPTAAGDAFPAELSVTYGAATARQTAKVSLTGGAANPAVLALSDGPTYDFGDKAAGTILDHSFTLTNSGGLVATALAPAALAVPFSFKGGSYPGTGGTCATSLDPAGSCTVVVTFTAQVFGDHTGTLSIGYQSGLGAQTASVGLKAKSHSPAVLSLSDEPTFDFGNVVVGAVAEHSFEVTNAGGANAALISATALALPFAFKGGTFPGTGGGCGATLAPQATCTVVVTFTPAARTGASGDLKLSYDDGAASQTATRHMTGSGSTAAVLGFNGFDFGQVNVGSSLDHTFTVNNTGEASATGVAVDPLASGFSFKGGAFPGTGGTCASAISASCTLVITFAPSKAGTVSTALKLSYHDGLAAAATAQTLTGTGYVPATLAFGNAIYAFGTIAPSGTAETLLTLANTGSVAATSLAFDALPTPFAYKGGTFPGIAGTCGTTVGAGAYCMLDVVYKPTAVGSSSASFGVSYQNGSGTSATASTTLTGTAVGTAWLEITDFPPEYYSNFGIPPDPATFAFMSMGVGLTQDHTFSVNNTGAADGTFAAGDTLSGPFSFKGGTYPGIGGTCGTSFPKGSSCTVVVSFAPTALGDFTSTLSISFNSGTATRPLSGTATDKALLVIFDYDIGVSFGPAFDFGVVGVGVPVEHRFFLGNAGAQAATAISGLALPAPFAYTGGTFPGSGGTCGDTLAPFSGCEISITFEPAAAGPFAGTLDVSYDEGGATAHVTRDLRGTGTTAALLVLMGQGPNADFGPVPVNGRSEREIDVNNVGGATATGIAARALTAPFRFKDGAYPGTGGTCGASLPSGTACRLVVVFEPTAAAASAASLILDYDDGLGGHPTAQVGLLGTGISTALLVIRDWQGNNGGGDFGSNTFDFGVQGAAVQHAFYVRNQGAQAATAVSGTLAAPFTFTGGTYPGTGGTCGTSLPAGAECTVDVTFTPSGDGAAGGTLRLAYHDGAAAQTAVRALAGTSTTGANLVLMMCVNCGDGGGVFDLGVVGAPTHGLLYVHNNGAKAASSITPGSPALGNGFSYLNGAYPGEGGTCGQTLAAGASCTLAVAFTPQGTGPRTATLRLDYQDGNGKAKTVARDFYAYAIETALLTIVDWPSQDALNNQGSSFDFGLTGVPVEHTFFVANQGAKDATGMAVAALADGFALKTANLPNDACGTTLAPGGYCSLTVVYTPGTAGMHQATLTIDYQDGSGAAAAKRPMTATTTTLALLEIRNCQNCGGNDSSYGFGIVGQPSERTLYVYNRGGGTATSLAAGQLGSGFSLKTANLPQDACAATLAPNGACSITVVFTPNGSGPRASTLTVSYFNGSANASVSRDLTATSSDRAMLLVYDWTCQNCGGTDLSRPFDFGTSGSPVDHEFMVVNLGALDATSLAGSLGAGFTFKGGTFPGTNGTCTATLPKGSGCTVVLTFTPPANTNGPVSGNLVLNYYDGFAQAQVARALTGTATSLALLRLNDSPDCPNCGGDTFDTGPTGQPIEHAFWVHNIGAQDATSMTPGALSTGFSFKGGSWPGTGGTCTQTLAKGAHCSVVLAFSPTGLSAGTYTSALSVSYQNGSATASASITINVRTTTLALLRLSDWSNCPDCGSQNDQPFAFGTVAVASTLEHTFSVNNVGGQAATGLSADQFTGIFTFKGGTYPGAGGTCGAQLAAGASCALVVTFTPSVAGRADSNLRLTYQDGSGTTKSVERWLSGMGTDQAILEVRNCMNCGPTGQVDFGTTGVLVERTFTVVNLGAREATSLGTSQLGNGFAFKGTGTWPGTGGSCSATLAKGANCTFVVTFDPAALQDAPYSFQLSLGYFDGSSNQQVRLGLTATATHAALLKLGDWSGCPDCGTGPNPYDFGTTGLVQEHQFWLFNVGGALATGVGPGTPALGDGFSFKGGPYPGSGGTCGTTLAAGSSCSVVVAFTPSGLAAGAHSSSLTIKYGTGTTVSRALAATSTDKASLEIADCDSCTGSDRPRDFGTWGIATTRVLSVRNLGAAAATNLRVGMPALGDGFSFAGGNYPGTGGNCGTTLASAGACAIAVTFSPGALAAGTHQSTLALAYDGGAAAGATATRQLTANLTKLALLVLSEGNPDGCGDNCGPWWFNNLQVGTSDVRPLTVFNVGAVAATSIAEPSPPIAWAPFDWAGHGAIPGLNGTCTAAVLASLAPGGSCTLEIGFYPMAAGSYQARRTLDYQDGSGTKQTAGRTIGGSAF